MPSKKKQSRAAEPFWNDMVSIFFKFCKEKFDAVPTFDHSQPRDLKSIIIALRKRCEDSGREWDFETATSRFRHFLEYAHENNQWLRNNWLLSNLDRQKDAVFFNISKQRAGK